MKRKLFFVLVSIVASSTFLVSCKKESEFAKDERLSTPLPTTGNYCRIESIWENPGGADERYVLILYDQYENPTAITTPFPGTGHPFRAFKYDQWHRLREYLGDYGNRFFEFWHFYGFDLNGRIGVDTVYKFGALLDKPTNYFERIISQIQYDNQGRIIQVSNISSHGVSSVDTYEYDAAGNLVYPFGPAVVYDNKVNVHRTNDIWMFLARDYSMNNPFVADAYNPTSFPTTINSSAPDRGQWSTPVHLGPEINSPSRELGVSISPDGLNLYFGSDRPVLGNGPLDIYVSHRTCLECPWQTAQIIGSPISEPSNDGTPMLSPDGHLLFFCTDRSGMGSLDLWVSHRQNPNDNFGWEAPVNLGPLVNSAEEESSPSFVDGDGHPELYFARGSNTWVAPISQQGIVQGPAIQVNLGGEAQSPSVRNDERELVFWRSVAGNTDIWGSTHSNVGYPWSAPVNLGAPVNTAGGEMVPVISTDGNTLAFSGNMQRGGSLGRTDIWISTRAQYFSFANTDIHLTHSQIGYGCRQSYW